MVPEVVQIPPFVPEVLPTDLHPLQAVLVQAAPLGEHQAAPAAPLKVLHGCALAPAVAVARVAAVRGIVALVTLERKNLNVCSNLKAI